MKYPAYCTKYISSGVGIEAAKEEKRRSGEAWARISHNETSIEEEERDEDVEAQNAHTHRRRQTLTITPSLDTFFDIIWQTFAT